MAGGSTCCCSLALCTGAGRARRGEAILGMAIRTARIRIDAGCIGVNAGCLNPIPLSKFLLHAEGGGDPRVIFRADRRILYS